MTEIGREHNRLCAVIAVLALRDLRSGAADVRILPCATMPAPAPWGVPIASPSTRDEPFALE
jgi:hypothetical protein